MPVNDELVQASRKMIDQGKTIDEVLAYFRDNGCSKIDSISLLVKTSGIGLREAKRVVHCSGTWSDVRDADDKFLDQILNVGNKQKPEEGSE